MRNIFRKALTVLGSAALIGSTIGVAAAAAYPAPFTSNTAIVVGANAAATDNIAATTIAADLDAASAGSSLGTSTTVESGDSYKFEKPSTKFHLGDTITAVVSSALDNDELPELLADGVYVDTDNDEFDYEQSITMAASELTMFEDSDYEEDVPTLGFRIASAGSVLNYTLEFNDMPLIADMENTDLTFMGKEYFVLEAAFDSLTLLDSATKTIISEGESATVTAGGSTYTVSIKFVDSDSAILVVNGESTNNLGEGETYKLDDGSYVGIKEVLYSAKDTGISQVEFSIGSGKLVLDDGQEIELNDEAINGLEANLVNSTTSMSSIGLIWKADDDLFITQDTKAVMPGFETVQLAFSGLSYPAEEEILIADGGDEYIGLQDFPLKDAIVDIPLLYGNGTHFTAIGADTDDVTRTSHNGTLTFTDSTDEFFIGSWSDGRDAESYMFKATNWIDDDGTDKVTIQYKKGTGWADAQTDAEVGDTIDRGNFAMTLDAINRAGKTVTLTATGQNNFNTTYSAEGLGIYLPVNRTTNTATGAIAVGFNLTAAGYETSYKLRMFEENEDGDKLSGDQINVTLGWNGATTGGAEVSTYTTSGAADSGTGIEIEDTDMFRNFVESALATELLLDTDPDQQTLKLIYHGDEVTADVYITASNAVFSGGSAGVMTVTDSAVSTVAGKNLIVVGGSAINSVAAELLGGAYSEAAFTTATGVGAGEFLIQSFDRAGKTALLVAGYNAADTTKAATYLVNNDVDTTVGKKYKGTSATEASLMVA